MWLGNTLVSGNNTGIAANAHSMVLAGANSRIEGNLQQGIMVSGGSVLNLWFGTVVTGNRGSGVELTDVSNLAMAGASVSGNLGAWDIVCAPSPAEPGVHGEVSGLASGTRVNCPGLIVQ